MMLIMLQSSGCRFDRAHRIAYVNSYHKGYGSSDDVMAKITETLRDKNVVLEVFFLDAKRKSNEDQIQKEALLILDKIKKFDPDLLIVSDDNAVKELVVPFYNHTDLPVVFCGVNWSADQYQLGDNVTGMLEVLPLRKLLTEVKAVCPDAKNLAVISENSLSEQNNRQILDTLYRNLGFDVRYYMANDFENWKKMFMEANSTADVLYLPTNGAVKNWDDQEARKLVESTLLVPAVTCDDFMMPYAVYGLTKVAGEQGEWAALTALEVLNGKNPNNIAVARNTQSKRLINHTLAEKLGFKIRNIHNN